MSDFLREVELARPRVEYPSGFALVAQLIASDDDKTSTIFRRFDRLAARSLLYLQAKLQRLEAVQDSLDNEDLRTDDHDYKRAATSWEDFEGLSKTEGPQKERMKTAEDIQETLKAYRE